MSEVATLKQVLRGASKVKSKRQAFLASAGVQTIAKSACLTLKMRWPHKLCLLLAFLLPTFASAAGSALADTDLDGWRSVASATMSRDGAWLGYSYMPQVGDGEIILRPLAGGPEQRVPVGALPPAPTGPSPDNPERAAPRREVTLLFTSDGRFAVATRFPDLEETRAARKAKKKADQLPKEGIVIVTLATGEVTRIDDVKSFQVPAKGGSWLAYLRNPSLEPTQTKAGDGEDPASSKKDPQKKTGSDLVLRDLASGSDRILPHVVEYSITRDGRCLVCAVASTKPEENGVFCITPGDAAAPVTLVQGPGRYEKLAWDRKQTRLAFLTDRAEHDAKRPRFAAWLWQRQSTAASELIGPSTPGIPEGWVVSENAAPSFTFNGTRLLVSTAPSTPEPDKRLSDLPDEEKVTADLWRWNDDEIQPLQKVRAERERKRAYVGAWDFSSQRFTQLADPTLATVTLSDDGACAFGTDDRAYRRRYDYDGTFQDAYLVDASTGKRRLIAKDLGGNSALRISPSGKCVVWFADRQWFAIDTASARIVPLTGNLPVAFHNELNDLPGEPAAYGFAGWSETDDSVLLYDRFDLWQVFPDGRPARNVTAGYGREQKIQLRLQNIEPIDPDTETHGIDPSKPLYLRGESEVTRATGFFRTMLASTGGPDRLLWEDKNLSYVGRAADADKLLLTGSRFDEFPDILSTTSTFARPAKVSNGGAQLAPFAWGSAELMTYRNADGVELQAALCKPADFDPSKKYPLIVYIYERLSQTLHTFTPPAPSQLVNPTVYTSNGYLVLMPDIVYNVGQPGPSAVKCVLPAVETLIAHGFVDEKAIGIQGHSWGGYQIAYLVTQTHLFRAAAAGAVVSNMTSAYSGIRLASGRARQFQYEKTQSRIGRPLSDAPHLYLENSPLFGVDRITTPLLLLHNDHDDAVPWQQGIEFFLALRRLGKEAYLFNYNNALHGLRRRADQLDYGKRLRQFFDHFLKGEPAPDWMTSGIPYLDRDAEKLRFRDAP